MNASERPLRIVHLLSSLNVGGLEQFVLRIAVQLLYRACGPLLDEAHRLGLSVTQLRSSGKVARAIEAVAFFLRANADVVHSHNAHMLPYAVMAKLRGRPAIVMTRHSQRAQDAPSRYEVQRTDAVVAVSGAAKAALEVAWPGFRGKVSVIHNGVEPRDSIRSRTQVRQELGATEDDVVGVIVARIDDLKGHADLLTALSLPALREPPFIIWIAGDGERRLAMEALTAELGVGDKVRFLGFRSDVTDLLGAADFFVLPSLMEGFPLSVLEAMAQKLPVIVTPVGGVTELIADDRYGITVPVNDTTALAEALRRMATGAALRERLGVAGFERVRNHFSWEHMLSEYEALYRRLLA
jgi:L-malate glycosyltransferase